MSIMNTKFKAVVLALGLGTATLAAAQSPEQAQTFANQIQQWQALSGIGTYTFHTPPVLGNKAQDPAGNESFSQRFADMQAESSNDSGRWQETQPTLTAKAADPEGKEPFAQRFSEMQAASSNSGEWAFHSGANVPADEANSTLVVAKPASHVVSAQIAASQK
jgi:hypothetical protein